MVTRPSGCSLHSEVRTILFCWFSRPGRQEADRSIWRLACVLQTSCFQNKRINHNTHYSGIVKYLPLASLDRSLVGGWPRGVSDVYVYFSNDAYAYAVYNARTLAELLAAPMGLIHD
jgi:hypothetical protein